MSTRLAHTDNVGLAAEGSELPESIAEITAGINFARSEQRHDTSISYQVQGVFYNESKDSDEVFNTLNASSKIALVLEHLFMDVYAVHDQTIIDPAQKNSFNKLALTGNRTDVSIFGASPYLALEIGENVTGEVRLSTASVDYADEELQDDDERLAFFTLGNSLTRRGPSWAVSYDNQEFDYELSPSIELETFAADLGFWVNESVRLFTIQGLESDYALVAASGLPGAESPGLDDHFWYAGVDWRPSDRTEIVVSSGERNYGDTYRLSWQYRTARGGINLGYTEEPSTSLREHLYSARQTGEQSPIDVPDGPNGNRFFLQKRADLAFILDRPRSSAALRFFDETRFDIVEAVTESSSEEAEETEEYRGTEATLSWSLNSIGKLGLGAQVARRRSSFNAVDDEIKRLSISYERRVGRKGSMLITASQEKVEPMSEVGEIQYDEKQISIALRRSFGTAPGAGAPQRYYGYLDANEDY